MTTPLDVSGYVDLTLYDVDVPALVDRALARVVDTFPEWTPREGNVEVVLLEALAVEVQEVAYAVNRTPGAVVETVLGLFGLTRDAGNPPTASLLFDVQTIGEARIPAGTSVAVVVPGGADPVVFRTDREVVAVAGATSVTAPAIGTAPTVDANSLPPTVGVLLDPVSFVIAVTVTITGAGSAPEDVDAFLNRGAQRFKRISSTLIRPEHYTAAALEVPAVQRAATIERYDPNVSPPEGRRGHVTVAVSGAGGAPLAADAAADLRRTLIAQGHSGLQVHVTAPTITAVDVAATLTRLPGATREDVDAAARAALTAYLNPDAWKFGAKVYRNELISLLDRVEGVDLVDLTTPSADVTLAGVAPLATAGTLTLTLP